MIDKNTIEDGLQQAVKNDYNLKQIIRGRDYSEGFKKGAEWAIEQLQPKWIKLSDRTPELHGAYIVKWETRGMWACMWLKKDGKWQFDHSDVTHWMEFPAEPKED